MGFGNLGIWEMLVIGLFVLLVFGPRRLPEIARSMGKALREFKRGVNEIQRELEEAERGARVTEPRPPPAPAPRSSAAEPQDVPPGSPTAEEERRQAGDPTEESVGAHERGEGGEPDRSPDPDQVDLFREGEERPAIDR